MWWHSCQVVSIHYKGSGGMEKILYISMMYVCVGGA